jgi:hypothetical protein
MARKAPRPQARSTPPMPNIAPAKRRRRPARKPRAYEEALSPASMRHVGVMLREGFDLLIGDVAAHSASRYAAAWPHNLRHGGLFRLFGVSSSSRLASRPHAPSVPNRRMNPWSIWIWPWASTMDMHRRAIDSLGEVDETVARDEPEWTTPNRAVVDLAALRLRDFSVAQEGRHPVSMAAQIRC